MNYLLWLYKNVEQFNVNGDYKVIHILKLYFVQMNIFQLIHFNSRINFININYMEYKKYFFAIINNMKYYKD